MTDVSFVERNRRLEPVLRVCHPDHREPPFFERAGSPLRPQSSLPVAAIALLAAFLGAIFTFISAVVRLDFLGAAGKAANLGG